MRIPGVNPPGDHGADDGDHGADRKVDSFRADDDRHAERDHRRRHGAVENVDQVAEQAAFNDANVEETGRYDAVDGEDEHKRDHRPDRTMSCKRSQPQIERPVRLGV